MADAFDPQHAGRLEDPARLAALPQAAVVSLLRLAGDETVVDYGAGTGIYTIAVAEALPGGRVIAVEALPRLAEMLRAKLTPELIDRIELVETDANVVPVPDGADGVMDRALDRPRRSTPLPVDQRPLPHLTRSREIRSGDIKGAVELRLGRPHGKGNAAVVAASIMTSW